MPTHTGVAALFRYSTRIHAPCPLTGRPAVVTRSGDGASGGVIQGDSGIDGRASVRSEIDILPVADRTALGMKIGLGIGQQDSNRRLVVQARTSDGAGHGFSGLRLTDDLNGIRAGRRIAGAAVLHEWELQVGYASQRIGEVPVKGSGGDAGEIGIGRATDGGITAAPTGVSGNGCDSGQGEAIGAGWRENRGASPGGSRHWLWERKWCRRNWRW